MIWYIILGVLAWLLGSLGTTWLIGFIDGDYFERGLDEAFKYFLFIVLWPMLLIGMLIYLVCEAICKFFTYIIGCLQKIGLGNPLLIWNKVFIHGAKRNLQKHQSVRHKEW